MIKVFKQSAGIPVYFLMLILTLAANSLNAQLVTNGSFENTVPGPVTENDIEGWVLDVSSTVSAAPDFEIVVDTVQSGSHALRVVVNAIGPQAWDIQVVADSIPIKPGATYKYFVWAKSETSGAQANFTVGNYDFNEYGFIRPATLSDEWQEFTFEFTITDQETFARGPIHFSTVANVGNTIYIDNMRIIDVEQELASRYPVTFEADSGEVGSDFAVQHDGEITYIQILTDGADFTPAIWNYPGYESRVATYEVTFPAGGTYNLFAQIRVGPNRYDDDSFFYSNGFGTKDPSNNNDWITVNGLQAAGFSDSNNVVNDPGGLGEGIWKWVNLSKNVYQGEQGITFTVEEDSLTKTFQIGGRENVLDIAKFAFGRADLYYTVGNLDKDEPVSTELPGEVWNGPPLASGQLKFVGSAHSSNQAPNFAAYWNQVTPENAGKWGSVEGTRDVMNWGGLDAAYNFAKNNGFPFTFHVLVWGNQQPNWMENLANSPDEQLQEIRQWFQAVADRYHEIDYLQVVNEPLHDPPDGPGDGNYINALGGSNGLYGTGWDWIIKAFELASKYFPDSTKLMINDYNVVNSDANTTNYLNIINLLMERELIDGIGVQGHAFSTRGSMTTITNNLNRLAETGLPIQVCELDIDGSTDQVQLEDYQKIIPTFWEHPAVEGITLWDWRPGMWRTDEMAYLVSNDGTERPALVWLRDYIQSTILVSVENPVVEIPQVFYLSNNYPNPFNPTTTIEFSLSENSDIHLVVYDVLGRIVADLARGNYNAGYYKLDFNASNLVLGIYFYKLEAGEYADVKKLMLLK